MDIPSILLLAAATLVLLALFYFIGRLLGRRWWLLGIVFGLGLIIGLIFVVIGINTPPPKCADYAVMCAEDEHYRALIGFFVSVASGICLILGLPIAYLGARNKAKSVTE